MLPLMVLPALPVSGAGVGSMISLICSSVEDLAAHAARVPNGELTCAMTWILHWNRLPPDTNRRLKFRGPKTAHLVKGPALRPEPTPKPVPSAAEPVRSKSFRIRHS